MNKLIKISTLLCLGMVTFFSCQKEFQFEFAQNGPDMTVKCAAEALLGGKVNFSAEVSDKNYPLSVLKAQLYTDFDVEGSKPVPVSEFEVRTKEAGTYEGSVTVPYSIGVPDGIMKIVFTAVNTHLGYTYDTVSVKVTRPKYEYLTLKTEDGAEYRMDAKTVTSDPSKLSDSYWFAYTGSFGAECNAYIVTPEFKDVPEMTFGWGGTGIALNGAKPIPFSNGVAGEYEVSFNTYDLSAGPFIVLELNGVQASMTEKDRYAAVVNIKQNDEINITGFNAGFTDWTIDPDYIEAVDAAAGKFKFLPCDGLYKFIIEVDKKFIRVEGMKSASDLGTLNQDGTGTLWLIGEGVGKPTNANAPSWNPEQGGLALAQISPKKHQITFIAGVQLDCKKVNFKFFHQKTWGGEFKFENISTTSEIFKIDEKENGNVMLNENQTLDMGGIYRFTVDLTASSSDGKAISGAVLSVEKVGQIEIEPEKIVFAGVEMEMISGGTYGATINLTKGQNITVSGVDSPASWYMDPDYFTMDASGLKFNATDGKYYVAANIDSKFVSIKKLKEDGNDATLAEGALWLMGWGTGHPVMTSQFGWTPGAAYCMAEISPRVFQFTGIAVDEKDGTTMGGRFRFDYLSFKYFHQNGWGGEKGAATIEYTERAKALIKNDGEASNSNIGHNCHLEKGATYVLTIDLSDSSKEVIDFYKK